MKQLKNYIKSQARDFISYEKWVSILSIVSIVIFLTNEIQEIYFSNPPYFLESLFRFTNIFYFLSLGLVVFIFYRRSALLLFILIVFYLDFFFLLKKFFQTIVFQYSDGDHFVLVYGIVFIILSSVLALMFFIPHRHLKFFSFFIFFFYTYGLISTQLLTSRNHIPSKVEPNFRVKTIKRDLYIFLFDEYPSVESYKRNFKEDSVFHADSALRALHFSSFKGFFSNYPNTEKSVTSFLTGTLHDSIAINNVIDALENNMFTQGENYTFHAFSIFDKTNRPNSLVTTQFFRGINSTMSRYVAPYIISSFSNRGVGNFTNYADYHTALVNELKAVTRLKSGEVFFGHFYTPHYYPRVINENLNERLKDAYNWMNSAIEIVQSSDSSASIMIISDHGLRLNRMPASDYNKNILYYKNLNIDTVDLGNHGLYKLIESIDFQ
jgi:hypothetical protein